MTSPYAPNARLHCAECSVNLQDALILSCDHNLCLPCASVAVQSRHSSAGSEHSVICRLCGASTIVDGASASQLREIKVSETRRPAPSSASPSPLKQIPPCGQCDSRTSTLHCLHCQEYFCDSCGYSVHRRGRMQNHQLSPLEDPSGTSRSIPAHSPHQGRYHKQDGRDYSSSLDKTKVIPRFSSSRTSVSATSLRNNVPCRDHPDEQVQYFCLQCEVPCVCAECVVHGPHKDHDVQNIKKAYPAVKGKVEDFLLGIGNRIEELGIVEQRIEQHRRELSGAVLTAKQQMAKAFDDVKQRLAKKESELMSNADQFLDQSIGELDGHVRTAKEKSHSLEDTAAKIRLHLDSSDEVTLLNYYADVRSALAQTLTNSEANDFVDLPESATRRVFKNVENTNAHIEALNNLHLSISALKGLDPSDVNIR